MDLPFIITSPLFFSNFFWSGFIGNSEVEGNKGPANEVGDLLCEVAGGSQCIC